MIYGDSLKGHYKNHGDENDNKDLQCREHSSHLVVHTLPVCRTALEQLGQEDSPHCEGF